MDLNEKMISIRVECTAAGILLMIAASAAVADGIGNDMTPDQFTFVDQIDVTAGMPVVSAPVTILGINNALTVVTVSGGEYSIGCTGTWASGVGSIFNGMTVCVRHSAPLASLATTDTTLTVGGVSDTFSSRTESLVIVPPDSDPDPFDFTAIDGVMPGVTVTSTPITLTGFNIALQIDADNGDLDIGCDGIIDVSTTSDPLYVESGASVCVRNVASIYCGTTVTTTLSVGSYSTPFSTTTQMVSGACVNPTGSGAPFTPIVDFHLKLTRRFHPNLTHLWVA